MSEIQHAMSRLIQNLQIKKFKSIRDLSLDCDRINIFIGRPNAGKSNILEAISLLGAGYAQPSSKWMEHFIRYKTIPQLFNSFDFREKISIIANETIAELRATSWGDSKFKFYISTPPPDEKSNWEEVTTPIDFGLSMDGYIIERDPKGREQPSPVKKYTFLSFDKYQERGLFLQPPHGENFYLIAQSNSDLRMEIQRFLKPNGLEFLLDIDRQQMAVVQKTETTLLSYPMHLVPDTFQRYIFHLAAILSNQNSVLLFEEPESHSYPPYIYQLAQYILQDDRNNQYFLTTHNPYLLSPILGEAKDVALFLTWFEDYQTYAKRLSDDEIREILDFGVDIFLNLDQFIPA